MINEFAIPTRRKYKYRPSSELLKKCKYIFGALDGTSKFHDCELQFTDAEKEICQQFKRILKGLRDSAAEMMLNAAISELGTKLYEKYIIPRILNGELKQKYETTFGPILGTHYCTDDPELNNHMVEYITHVYNSYAIDFYYMPWNEVVCEITNLDNY